MKNHGALATFVEDNVAKLNRTDLKEKLAAVRNIEDSLTTIRDEFLAHPELVPYYKDVFRLLMKLAEV